MIQRGRKSVASLASVTPLPGQRPIPPRHLPDADAAVWRQTVATKPSDWWQADSWPMLEAYCAAVVMHRVLSAKVSATVLGDDPVSVGMLDKLCAMRDREGKAINTYARAMRLTQQSRLKAETAATAHSRANGTTGGARKPWETA